MQTLFLKTTVAIFISDKMGFKMKKISRDRKGHDKSHSTKNS